MCFLCSSNGKYLSTDLIGWDIDAGVPGTGSSNQEVTAVLGNPGGWIGWEEKIAKIRNQWLIITQWSYGQLITSPWYFVRLLSFYTESCWHLHTYVTSTLNFNWFPFCSSKIYNIPTSYSKRVRTSFVLIFSDIGAFGWNWRFILAR